MRLSFKNDETKSGYPIFALQNGGWCAGSATGEDTYKRYGASTECVPDGKGGPLENQVYKIYNIRKY